MASSMPAVSPPITHCSLIQRSTAQHIASRVSHTLHAPPPPTHTPGAEQRLQQRPLRVAHAVHWQVLLEAGGVQLGHALHVLDVHLLAGTQLVEAGAVGRGHHYDATVGQRLEEQAVGELGGGACRGGGERVRSVL